MLLRWIDKRKTEIEEGTAGDENKYLDPYRLMSRIITRIFGELLAELDAWIPDQCDRQMSGLDSPTQPGYWDNSLPTYKKRVAERARRGKRPTGLVL